MVASGNGRSEGAEANRDHGRAQFLCTPAPTLERFGQPIARFQLIRIYEGTSQIQQGLIARNLIRDFF
jgi:alkylation response protein AidB-like acyl-CoA dehydrogenase